MRKLRPTIRPGRDYNYRARQRALEQHVRVMRALRKSNNPAEHERSKPTPE
jgi:uncharacterized protein with gpF-like domain